MKRVNARQVALDLLTQMERRRSFSNLLLNETLQKHALERADANLVTEIVYGTIQRRNTIDYFLDQFVKKGVNQLEDWVRQLLRLSFYQLYYLDRIPAHAVVNEAVNIAKQKGHKGIASLVNGVLRNVIREKAKLRLPDELDPIERIALQHSHPTWLVARWVKQYGIEVAEAICAANNERPRVSVRVNTLATDRDALLAEMREEQVQASPSELVQDGIIIKNYGNIAFSKWYEQGKISIQDESSMVVAHLVAAEPGMMVLDCCAAPGGKTTHIAEMMRDEGTIWASDIHGHKQRLIERQAARLHLRSIKTMVSDALELGEAFPAASFDRILVDAPCSGTGVIRRKPDIKWLKDEAEIKRLPELQLGILTVAARLLSDDGALIYSTCTLEREENEDVIASFLAQHAEFELDASIAKHLPEQVAEKINVSTGIVHILPYQYQSDGFFVAKLRKRVR